MKKRNLVNKCTFYMPKDTLRKIFQNARLGLKRNV